MERLHLSFDPCFFFAVGSVRSDELDPLSDLTSCSTMPSARFTTLDAVTLVDLIQIVPLTVENLVAISTGNLRGQLCACFFKCFGHSSLKLDSEGV